METDLIVIIGANLVTLIGVGAALAGLILRQGSRLDRRIDGLQAQIMALQEQMNHRFTALQEQMDRRFTASQEHMDRQIASLQEQITALQEQTDRRFDAMQEQMDRRFDAMQGPLNGLQERVARIEGILTRQTAFAEEAMRAQG